MRHSNPAASTPELTPRRPRQRIRARDYHCALHQPGAVSLSPDELGTVTRALVILEKKVLATRELLTTPATVKQWLTLHYGMLQREVFGLLLLDTQNRLLAHEQPFTGTVDSTSVYPREVARIIFEYNAAAVIAVHCHPSASKPEPSRADEAITSRLKQTLGLLDVRLLDHFIVSGNEIMSFAERGLL
jgi:DNA repair protein RadC